MKSIDTLSALENIGLSEAYAEAPDGVVIVGRDGMIYTANKTVTRLLGWPIRMIVGKPLNMLIPDRVTSHHGDWFDQWMSHPKSRHMGNGSVAGKHQNGKEVPLFISLSYVETELGLAGVAWLRYRGSTTWPEYGDELGGSLKDAKRIEIMNNNGAK